MFAADVIHTKRLKRAINAVEIVVESIKLEEHWLINHQSIPWNFAAQQKSLHFMVAQAISRFSSKSN